MTKERKDCKKLTHSEQETHSTTERLQIEDRMVFRVQKKLGKVIYLNGGKGKLRKSKCSLLSNKIEEFIRNESKTLSEY